MALVGPEPPLRAPVCPKQLPTSPSAEGLAGGYPPGLGEAAEADVCGPPHQEGPGLIWWRLQEWRQSLDLCDYTDQPSK